MRFSIITVLISMISIGVFIVLLVLMVLGLLKYSKSNTIRKEKEMICQSLGETLKEYRTHCKMTQEFVAEAVGVSRQAVSKWENGSSDPSTSNLLALAKLFGVSVEELLKGVK